MIPRIWYLTPYTITKQLGKEYNSCIAQLPDSDWICVRDGDTIFTTPESLWGKQLLDIVLHHGKTYSLFGCVTNRLRERRQLYDGRFCSNPDWNEHKRRGAELFTKHYSCVEPVDWDLAGVLLLFPKVLWNEIQFSEEPPYYLFDYRFSRAVRSAGYKQALMSGVYLFHDYRWGKTFPTRQIQHLKASAAK